MGGIEIRSIFLGSCGLSGKLVFSVRHEVAQREETVREVDILDDDGTVRLGKLDIRKIPDGINSVVREHFRNGDGGVLRNGENGDVDLVFREERGELIHRTDLDTVELRADQCGIDIKSAYQLKSPLAEAEVIHKGATYITYADEYGLEATIHS